MKIGERIRKEIAEKNSKEYLMKKLEETLLEMSDTLSKGCKLEFKNFHLEEKKEIVEALRDEELIVAGCYKYENEYLNSEYNVLWDSTGVKEGIFETKSPCHSCTDLSCLDGYPCYYLDEYYSINGKPYVYYDVEGLIRVEKVNEKYRVSIISIK